MLVDAIVDNLWIHETFVNATEQYRIGDSEWHEAFTPDRGELFRSLQAEYGTATKMYVDTDDGPVQVGWVFTKKIQYKYSKDTYTREVWVTVSTTKPEYVSRIDNITSPWKG